MISQLARELFFIRFFEEKIAQIYPSEIIRCPVHLAIGHEASAVGVSAQLKKQDKVFSYHRSHHHYLAKGGDPKKLLWELLGDSRGCSGGRGGSTHLIAEEAGFMASTAIISGTLPVASGVAHSLKLKDAKSICVVFCGDAGIEEGVFFETLNMATLWKLPLLVVIEDNDLSCYTPKSTRQALNDFKSIADLFKIDYFRADGSDIKDVCQNANSAVQMVRTKSLPVLLDIKVYRALEHCGPEDDDLLAYRQSEGFWPQMDPLFRIKEDLPPGQFEQIQNEVHSQIESLFQSVLKDRHE